ncbi:alpha/beta hydrolase [Alcaligenes sp. SORT26]|uniref:alpha/beta hydrolase n=1 Tax=Alcaligenes sp. SORT26 TaxID=2813780 RepID=UPI001A9ED656|nr:alpha/beta hydrolase [Alcaligenes sp. SORT26]QTC01196.1 alpha/beta hydrolase [Alcaligenes sp. SORT26]
MPKTVLQGSWSHRCRSALTLWATTVDVLARRAIARPLVPGWSIPFEIATLFYRKQFNHAFSLPSMSEGRAYFDSLYTIAEPNLPVQIQASTAQEPRGHWFIPRKSTRSKTMLYFHGGGYAFYPTVSRHFIALLAHHLQISIFAPDYRLTPDHAHPAQQDDALEAYRYLLERGTLPEDIILAGDSAGGHLVLMTLVSLRQAGLPQPSLALALSPWTDIGRRGASQFGYDRYDMVQGYQTLQYGQWLKGNGNWSDAQLSPIAQDLRQLAPLYIQAGGKEILVDMIRDFAQEAKTQGAAVRLDVWPDMTHEFHAYGSTLTSSEQAIAALLAAIQWTEGGVFNSLEETELDGLGSVFNKAQPEHIKPE